MTMGLRRSYLPHDFKTLDELLPIMLCSA